MTRAHATEAIAENRRLAMKAIHLKPHQSRRSFIMSGAADPILALASEAAIATRGPLTKSKKRKRGT